MADNKQPDLKQVADRPEWLPAEFDSPAQLVADWKRMAAVLRKIAPKPKRVHDADNNGTKRTDF